MQHHPSVVVQLSWVIRVVLVSVIIQRHKERGTLNSVQSRLVQSLREELLTGLGPLGPLPSRQTGHHLLSREWSGLVVQDVLQLHLDLTSTQQSVAVVDEDLVEAALVINYDMIRVLKEKRGKIIQITSSPKFSLSPHLIVNDAISLNSRYSDGVEQPFVLPRTQRDHPLDHDLKETQKQIVNKHHIISFSSPIPLTGFKSWWSNFLLNVNSNSMIFAARAACTFDG